MLDPLRLLGYALLAGFLLLASPFVIARAVEVWQGTYDEPIHSGATPDAPAWDDTAAAPCRGYDTASPH